MPLRAEQVDPLVPFDNEELLYRRVSPEELNSMGEVDPTRINATSFSKEIQSAPSVNRSAFSKPEDVLSSCCASGKDVSSWVIFLLSVERLPKELVAGDGRRFDFVPQHLPLEDCGAHSVIASCRSEDSLHEYVKPSQAVINDFKVKFATGLTRLDQVFDIMTKKKVSR